MKKFLLASFCCLILCLATRMEANAMAALFTDVTYPVTATGAEIPIEERSHDEVTHINGKIICSDKVNVINPGFDVTPNELIAGIITEKGILRPDYNKSIAEVFKA